MTKIVESARLKLTHNILDESSVNDGCYSAASTARCPKSDVLNDVVAEQ